MMGSHEIPEAIISIVALCLPASSVQENTSPRTFTEPTVVALLVMVVRLDCPDSHAMNLKESSRKDPVQSRPERELVRVCVRSVPCLEHAHGSHAAVRHGPCNLAGYVPSPRRFGHAIPRGVVRDAPDGV
jgi:hypothetical protein